MSSAYSRWFFWPAICRCRSAGCTITTSRGSNLLTFIPLVGIVLWALLVFTRGTDGENDYGHDPRHPEQVSTAMLGSVFS